VARNRGKTTLQREPSDLSQEAIEGSDKASEPAVDSDSRDLEEKPARTGPWETWSPGDTLALFFITLGAGILRLFRVADPEGFVFDEVYYAKDSCYYAKASLEACKLDSLTEVHPPLGKWLISVGIKIFGFDETGYRIMVVLGGTITVALLYMLGRALLASTLGASLAAALLAIDPLHFVQSRTSMLDVFVPLFGVAAFLFLVYDRRRMIEDRDAGLLDDGVAGLFARPWRIAAGVMVGAAIACKWTGLFLLPSAIVLTLVWEIAARKDEPRGSLRALRAETLSVLVWLLVAPAVVYVASYVGRLEGDLLAAPWTQGAWLRAFWDEQVASWTFHRELTSTHLYQSPGWSWILLKRPVSYFFETDAAGNYREILATGSPFVWWASIPALLYVAFNWVRRGELARPEGVILAGFLFSYAPWLLPMNRSAIFIFYFVATLPFMMLAIAYVAIRIGRSWEARAAVALFSIVAVGFFVFYYPLLTKRPLSANDWDRRLLFFQDCDKPEGKQVTKTITETVSGKAVPTTTTSNTNEDEPPPGWCWI
jgi:dolichyl-phosphate-mannose-protein mannosyltransferase